jgi:hypothetical protein
MQMLGRDLHGLLGDLARDSLVLRSSAVAAESANGPPEPMAARLHPARSRRRCR